MPRFVSFPDSKFPDSDDSKRIYCVEEICEEHPIYMSCCFCFNQKYPKLPQIHNLEWTCQSCGLEQVVTEFNRVRTKKKLKSGLIKYIEKYNCLVCQKTKTFINAEI